MFHQKKTELQIKTNRFYNLSKEYMLQFKHKIDIFSSIRNVKNMHFLIPALQKYHQDLLHELDTAKKEDKLAQLIISQESLTRKESLEFDEIKEKIHTLKQNLSEQSRIIALIFAQLKNEVNFDLQLLLEPQFKEMQRLTEQEQEILFGEDKLLDSLVKDVVEEKEVQAVKAVSCPAVDTAIFADPLEIKTFIFSRKVLLNK